MTRKDGHPSDEAFTLQFGEPDEAEQADEVVASGDAHVDDQFMWSNAATFLEEALAGTASAVKAAIETDPSSASDPETPDGSGDDVTTSGSAMVSFPDGEPMAIEMETSDREKVPPEAVDERQIDPVISASDEAADTLQEDIPADDDFEPMVLDERQVAMVSSPNDEVQPFPEASRDVLRAEPSAAVLPREDVAEDDAARSGALFADDMADVPPVLPPADHGRKAPWILYGTLGLGVAVVAVAAVGMALQLGRTDASDAMDAPAEMAAVAQEAEAPAAPLANEADIKVQLKVLRLAVGPFFDANSDVSPSQIDASPTARTSVELAAGVPDQAFKVDLGATLPVSVASDPIENFGAAEEETAVVTLSEDRIEIDLTEDGDGSSGPIALEASDAAASTTIDPKIKGAKAPELAAVQAETHEAPADDFASRALFDDLMSVSEDIAALDDRQLEAQPNFGVEDAFGLKMAALDTPLKRAKTAAFAQFDLGVETKADLVVPALPKAPLAAVRLASADSRRLPVDGKLERMFDDASPTPQPHLERPSRIAGAAVPEPNLPQPQIDVSGALLLAAKAAEAEAARLRAEEAELARNKAAAEEEARLAAADEAVAAPTTSALIAVVETAPQVEQEPVNVAEPAAEPEKLVPVQAEAPAATGSGVWVAEAVWVSELGFSVEETTQNGRGVLEVVAVDESSVLPAWAAKGSSILSVNGTNVETEAAFLDAMLGGSDDAESGQVDAALEIRARPGLDPRDGQIVVPVWRRVQLGDGTELSVRQQRGKWVTEVVFSDAADENGLKAGDVLLRDFMTKSNLRAPLALETLFDAMTESGETRVEFAVMRDGELSSGGVTLAE